MALPQRVNEIVLPLEEQDAYRPSAPRSQKSHKPRRRFNTKGLVFASGFWVSVVCLCGLLTYRNALIQHELDQITRLREEIRIVERERQWLQAQVNQKMALAAVDAWATQNGLVRADDLVILPADLSSVVAEPPTDQPEESAVAEDDSLGLIEAIMSVLSIFSF